MKSLKFFASSILMLLMVSVYLPELRAQADNKYENLAKKLVTECASVKEGEIVLIAGSARDLELMEDIAVNVRKQGAFPLISIGSDRLTRRMYTDVPVKYDSQLPELDMKLFEMVNTVIGLEVNEDPGLLSDIPPERFITRNKAAEPVNEMIYKNNIKIVTLGNGMYPTVAKTKQYGLTMEELNDLFWNGLNVDYSMMQATGKKMKSLLSTGKELHIINPDGTDFKVRIENSPVFVSDGIIAPENLEKGTARSTVFLPAGEVYLSPVPGTAEGKIVANRVFYQDKEIIDLTLTFSKGKVVSMTAKSGLDSFKALYDAAEEGKEDFSVIDFGINPNLKVKEGSKFQNWIPAGTVSFNIGNNEWAGGENKSTFGYAFFISGSTVELDGKLLVEKGKLVF